LCLCVSRLNGSIKSRVKEQQDAAITPITAKERTMGGKTQHTTTLLVYL
jgi:hypothetical protein